MCECLASVSHLWQDILDVLHSGYWILDTGYKTLRRDPVSRRCNWNLRQGRLETATSYVPRLWAIVYSLSLSSTMINCTCRRKVRRLTSRPCPRFGTTPITAVRSPGRQSTRVASAPAASETRGVGVSMYGSEGSMLMNPH